MDTIPQTMAMKLVFLGDTRVGKSSIIIRYVKNEFDQYKFPSIGATFLTKSVCLNDYIIKFEIWDVHRPHWRGIPPLYYRGASAAIIVYDITNKESFENAYKWVEEVQCQEGEHVIIGIAANKVDLAENRQVSIHESTQKFASLRCSKSRFSQNEISLIVSGFYHQKCGKFIPLDLIKICILFYDNRKNIILFETSAKNGTNIEKIFTTIAQEIAHTHQCK
eukprot:173904_1